MAIRKGESFSDVAALPQSDAERMLEYTTDFVFMVEDRLEELGMSRAELARKLGCSKSQVTKVLSGSNVTLKTIAKYDEALSLSIRLEREPRSVSSVFALGRQYTQWGRGNSVSSVPYEIRRAATA